MRIITRDKKIQSRLAEIELVRSHKAKMFVLETDGVGTRWELLEVVVTNWRAMESFASSTDGPFVVAVTRTGGLRTLRTWQ